MTVVSNTTPLRHLIAIDKTSLLPALYGSITIPKAVWEELHAENTPAAIKECLENASWLKIQAVRKPVRDPAFRVLDAGEREAIQLAMDERADLLLIDDREGRAAGLRLGLPVSGTLGVLERADRLGILTDFPAILAGLERSGFYLSARLRDALHERYRRRHGLNALR